MKNICIIDNYMIEPAFVSFNGLIERFNIKGSYHAPSQWGFKSLEKAKHYDAIILLGSASNIEDKLSWHKPLADFVFANLQNNIPCLAICFGHQLMVDYFGGKIGNLYPDKTKFVGERIVNFIDSFGNIQKNMNLNFTFSHQQIVLNIPECFKVLAESELNKFEVLSHKNYPLITIQAHPEATGEFLTESVHNIENNLKSKNSSLPGGQYFIEQWLNLI